MDILTQGLLGTSMAQTVAQKKELRLASVIGFLSGLLADADVLISSSSDPLLNIEYHRHFSHALVFIPLGALLAAALLYPLLRNQLKFSRIYLYSLMGYSLSGFIDACTSYGTYLFWPFYPERIAFHIISIVDPLFTLVLLTSVIVILITRKTELAKWALLFCGLYLLLGLWQSQRAESEARTLAQQRGHEIQRLVVKPTLGNLVLWRSTYIAENRIYVDAIRVGMVDNKLYHGGSVPLFNPQTDSQGISHDSELYGDILRFKTFSDGFIAIDPGLPNVLGDIRYSMLPHTTRPLWGISLDYQQPGQHAAYNFYRDFSPEDRALFWSMLMGN